MTGLRTGGTCRHWLPALFFNCMLHYHVTWKSMVFWNFTFWKITKKSP